MIDQIERLRQINALNAGNTDEINSKIISFISGKGGTGKSFFSLNIAKQLAELSYKVLLVDLDINMPSIHLMINITPAATLNQYLSNECTFDELIYREGNLDLILSEAHELLRIDKHQLINFLDRIKKLSHEYDFVILDNPAGINDIITESVTISSDHIVVAVPEPTAVMDAYMISKFILGIRRESSIHVIMNKCENEIEGKSAFDNLNKASKHFLNYNFALLGYVENNPDVRDSLMKQSFIANTAPKSTLTQKVDDICKKIAKSKHLANNNQLTLAH
ncbi:MAG: AAA family ATPase [Melioribacteraceae bacterium]|nr:AAA family ATPase [Melioribacteraceae bacterium]MCF8355147.1 AAA family ATPase [Melioribacteraceae bacterium]MCF8392476.1 AAA family ATPase [Melioribacteraceae bacterium]MCF8418387.1 AAA family ATPase [Melioribacteraceae bacterium]